MIPPAMLAHLPLAGLLPRASTFAAGVDTSFLLILWFAEFFLVLLVALLIFFVVRFRRREGIPPGPEPRRAGKMLALAGLALAVLVGVFFFHGFLVWQDMRTPPRDTYAIQVRAQQARWSFIYPNGYTSDELHLPLDRPVRLAMRSEDLLYSFAAPAFRVKMDVLPGRESDAWLQALEAGEYEVRCAQYCGPGFEEMVAKAVVHPKGEFETWLQGVSGPPLDLPPIELGRASYQFRGCTQCHTIDGTKLIGPSFKGFLAREHRLQDGTLVEPSDEYIRESILDSKAKVLAGYEPVMPSFKGKLHELEVKGLVEFIKSLK